METFTVCIAMTLVIWVAIRSMSFGAWTWKKNNKLGAAMIFLLSLGSVILPVYTVFIRGKT